MHDESTAVDPSAPIVLLAGASLCELISASLACSQQPTCSGLRAYAVSVGLVSIVLLAPIALVNFAEPLAPRRLYEGLPQISLLLLMWWMPACFLLTFVAPFSTLGNGYFATLGGAAGALQLSRAYVPALDTALHTVREMARDAPPDRAVLVMLALSSTLMWVQAAISAALYGDTPATKAWAIIVGVVSSVLCAFFLLLEGLTIHRLGFAMLMAAWWCQGSAWLARVDSGALSSLTSPDTSRARFSLHSRALFRAQFIHWLYQRLRHLLVLRLPRLLLPSHDANASRPPSSTLGPTGRGRARWTHHRLSRSGGQLGGPRRHVGCIRFRQPRCADRATAARPGVGQGISAHTLVKWATAASSRWKQEGQGDRPDHATIHSRCARRRVMRSSGEPRRGRDPREP